MKRTDNAEIIRMLSVLFGMERKMGIEPTPSAWEAEVLPLNYSRERKIYYIPFAGVCQEIFKNISDSRIVG